MPARSRTTETTAAKTAPASAESRTATLPCMPTPPPPHRPPVQLALAVALGEPDDQLVMPGCEDDRADPRRIYQPPTEATSAAAERKDGDR